ncbi:MAG: hypothetical protein KDD82_16990 [Planctomycetes bacterium]|nr:hypothetical protein [Planctomycetota bacterium]
MGDERLRELERRWRERGSLEAEAAWLKERVRAGELPRERLQLAATLGGAARLAWGEEPLVVVEPELWVPLLQDPTGHGPVGPRELRTLEGFDAFTRREGLCAWGRWLLGWAPLKALSAVRVASGAALVGYREWSKVFAPGRIEALGLQEWATESLCRLEGLCVGWDPCEAGYPRFGGDAFDAADQARNREGPAAVWAVEAVGHALLAAQHGDPREALLAIRKAASATDGATVLAAIQADLAPWLLGYGDPVRERVAKRGEA